MIKELRRKFIIVAMSSVFIVIAVIIGIINVVNYANVVKTSDQLVTLLLENGGGFGGIGGLGKPMSPETPYETRYFSVILDLNGSAVSVSTSQIAAVGVDEAVQLAEEMYEKESFSGFYGVYRYGAAETGSGGTMYVFVDRTKELSSFEFFLWISIAVGAAGFALVLILVTVLSGRVMKPVAESYSKQKRFITDASHEIKTPLTIIGADAEVLEMQSGENEWTASIKSEVKRLASLTEKLVFLARMDESNGELNAVDFSISDAVAETVKTFEAVAISKGLDMESEIQKNLTYCGDEAMIRQATSLLLDNAMKYTDDGGKILVCLQRSGSKIRFKLSNSAAELNSGSLNLLFERFYRSDLSRNSRTGGHGIGLSVVKAIVDAHNGKITAKSENGFAVFTAIL